MSDGRDYEYLAQTAHLRSQLQALGRKSRAVQRRYQMLEVRCRRCGSVLIEVVDLDPYPVVRHRRTVPRDLPLPPMGADHAEHWRKYFAGNPSPSIRLDKRWSFFAISREPRDDERSQIIPVACACSEHGPVSMVWLREQIAAGVKKATR